MLPLTSLRLLVVLGLAAVVLLATTVRALRRRGAHRRLVATASGLACVVLVVAGTAAAVNRHFGLYRSWASLTGVNSRDLVPAENPHALARATAPLPSGIAARSHGQLLSLHVPGELSQFPATGALVYLPPQYGAAGWGARGFPVAEAIPGSPGKPIDYINGMQADTQLDRAIAAHEIPPTIVVFPQSNVNVFRSLECTDTADGYLSETYLTTDVHAWVTQHLNTDRRRWTILGYSTGGYCALNLAYRHPDLFARAASLDGYMHALNDNYARRLWPRGGAGVQARLEHSPDWWVANHHVEPVEAYISAGTRDRDSARAAVRFWELLAATGWRHPRDQLVVGEHGSHTFPAWARSFMPALRWALGATPPQTPESAAQALRELGSSSGAVCTSPTAGPTPGTTPRATVTPSPGRGTGSPSPEPVPTCRYRQRPPWTPHPSATPRSAWTPSPSSTPSRVPHPDPAPSSSAAPSTGPSGSAPPGG